MQTLEAGCAVMKRQLHQNRESWDLVNRQSRLRTKQAETMSVDSAQILSVYSQFLYLGLRRSQRARRVNVQSAPSASNAGLQGYLTKRKEPPFSWTATMWSSQAVGLEPGHTSVDEKLAASAD